MATDMDVTTATFGTASLLLASGDPITDDTGSAWGGQVAQNTGWLYYQPRNLATLRHHFDTHADIVVGHSWVPAGTYSIYNYLASDFAGGGGAGSASWDGTMITSIEGEDGTATGSLCGWTTATSRWVQMTFNGTNTSPPGMMTGFAMRFGSYAP